MSNQLPIHPFLEPERNNFTLVIYKLLDTDTVSLEKAVDRFIEEHPRLERYKRLAIECINWIEENRNTLPRQYKCLTNDEIATIRLFTTGPEVEGDATLHNVFGGAIRGISYNSRKRDLTTFLPFRYYAKILVSGLLKLQPTYHEALYRKMGDVKGKYTKEMKTYWGISSFSTNSVIFNLQTASLSTVTLRKTTKGIDIRDISIYKEEEVLFLPAMYLITDVYTSSKGEEIEAEEVISHFDVFFKRKIEYSQERQVVQWGRDGVIACKTCGERYIGYRLKSGGVEYWTKGHSWNGEGSNSWFIGEDRNNVIRCLQCGMNWEVVY